MEEIRATRKFGKENEPIDRIPGKKALSVLGSKPNGATEIARVTRRRQALSTVTNVKAAVKQGSQLDQKPDSITAGPKLAPSYNKIQVDTDTIFKTSHENDEEQEEEDEEDDEDAISTNSTESYTHSTEPIAEEDSSPREENQELHDFARQNADFDDEVLEADGDEEEEEDDDDFVPLGPVTDNLSSLELSKINERFSNMPGIFDDDDEDTFDITMVAEYGDEIFAYMRELEVRFSPDPMYMKAQVELHWDMRKILIDWLVQVHARFNLLPETLFLTINYIDRFLSVKQVSLSKFQLVGAVGLFMAAKFEEINCPSANEVAYMVDHMYSVEEILKAERYMMDLLNFDLGWPGPMSFLRRISKADDYDLETRTLAKYLLEVTIMDRQFVASPPSWLAATSHYLARKLLNKGSWTDTHVYFSGYTKRQLAHGAEVILNCCQNPREHHAAIYDKYMDRRFKRASGFVQEWINREKERASRASRR